MTEQTLDVLRKHAERLVDEAQRFQRALKGSNASEDQAREHLTNVCDAADKAWADGLKVATVALTEEPNPVPVVVDTIERAVIAPAEVRGGPRKRGK